MLSRNSNEIIHGPGSWPCSEFIDFMSLYTVVSPRADGGSLVVTDGNKVILAIGHGGRL